MRKQALSFDKIRQNTLNIGGDEILLDFWHFIAKYIDDIS